MLCSQITSNICCTYILVIDEIRESRAKRSFFSFAEPHVRAGFVRVRCVAGVVISCVPFKLAAFVLLA